MYVDAEAVTCCPAPAMSGSTDDRLDTCQGSEATTADVHSASEQGTDLLNSQASEVSTTSQASTKKSVVFLGEAEDEDSPSTIFNQGHQRSYTRDERGNKVLKTVELFETLARDPPKSASKHTTEEVYSRDNADSVIVQRASESAGALNAEAMAATITELRSAVMMLQVELKGALERISELESKTGVKQSQKQSDELQEAKAFREQFFETHRRIDSSAEAADRMSTRTVSVVLPQEEKMFSSDSDDDDEFSDDGDGDEIPSPRSPVRPVSLSPNSKHRSLRATPADNLNTEKFRVSKKAKYAGRLHRFLEVNFETMSIRNLDGANQVMKQHHGNTVLKVDKSTSDSRKLRIIFSTKNRPYTVFFENAQTRNAFCDKLYHLRNMCNRATERVHHDGEELSLFVGTWNMGNAYPPENLGSWIQIGHDIYAIGVQECEYSSRMKGLSSADDFLSNVQSHLGSDFVRIGKVVLWEIVLGVYVRKKYCHKITNIETGRQATGLANICGNKGGTALSFRLDGSSFCFLNCHLASRPERLEERNNNISEIIKSLRLGYKGIDITSQFQYFFFFGDMNYRVMMPYQDAVQSAESGDYNALLSQDQLQKEMDANRALTRFSEGEIFFAPTYRYQRGSRMFSNKKNQSPSYCDRVLWSTADGREISLSSYSCATDIVNSDHTPVFATFNLSIPSPICYDDMVHSCMILISKVKAVNISPKKGRSKRPYVHVMFLGMFLDGVATTKPAVIENGSAVWQDTDVPQLFPFLMSREYLINQHLIVAITHEPNPTLQVNRPELVVAQGNLSLKDACVDDGEAHGLYTLGKAIPFEVELSSRGVTQGTIQGELQLNWCSEAELEESKRRSFALKKEIELMAVEEQYDIEDVDLGFGFTATDDGDVAASSGDAAGTHQKTAPEL